MRVKPDSSGVRRGIFSSLFTTAISRFCCGEYEPKLRRDQGELGTTKPGVCADEGRESVFLTVKHVLVGQIARFESTRACGTMKRGE